MKTLYVAKKLAVLAAVIAVVLCIGDLRCALDAQEASVVNLTRSPRLRGGVRVNPEQGLRLSSGRVEGLTGTVVKITGDVQVRRAGEKDWVAAKNGMELSEEDQIMTGAGSSADIEFIRNEWHSNVRILEEADMSLMTLDLDKITGDTEILLDLAIGHIIIQTDHCKGKSRFEVLTPTSMTAVRGTGFEVKVVREENGPAAHGGIAQ